MPVTQDMVDALNQAIADGVRQVTVGGQTTTYQTTDSLIKARDDMAGQLERQNQATASAPRGKITYYYQNGRGY